MCEASFGRIKKVGLLQNNKSNLTLKSVSLNLKIMLLMLMATPNNSKKGTALEN
jgi:hypothetical protein